MSTDDAQRPVTLYGCYGSFCTQKVYLTLAEKGVAAQRRTVNIGPRMENYDPWYARINPRMVIPTLDDGGTIVCDSSVIVAYIDDHFDGPPLMPDDEQQATLVAEWMRRIDRLSIRELSYGSLAGALGKLRDHAIMPMRLRVMRRHQRRNPDLREVYQRRIEDVEVWVETMRTPGDMAKRQAELGGVLDDLEAALAGGAEYLVGKRYTLADMMATVLVARLHLMTGIADLYKRPNLLAHYRRMRQRPGFPARDIVEKGDVAQIFSLVAPFLLPRIAAVTVLATTIGVGIWWLTKGV